MITSEILESSKRLKNALSLMSHEHKNSALINIAAALEEDCDGILRANLYDLNNLQCTMSEVILQRITIDAEIIRQLAEKFRLLAKLPDPIGNIIEETSSGDGIVIRKVSTPIGVLGFIFENCPVLPAEAAALCLKSGNVCVLRVNKEIYGTVRAFVSAMRKGLKKAGVSLNAVSLIEDVSNDSIKVLAEGVGFIDALYICGGKHLVDAVQESAKVPCVPMFNGIRHFYIDGSADFNKATDILNSAVCTSSCVCLVDKAIAEDFISSLYGKFVKERLQNPVRFKLDESAYSLLCGSDYCIRAVDCDFDVEFPDNVIVVKIVDGVKEAINHIAVHSTGVSDCIVTENADNVKLFIRAVDSASVYVNTPPVYTYGADFSREFGIGISAHKLYSRGFLGLSELTSQKYVILNEQN